MAYKVMTSFGGKLVSTHKTLAAAKRKAEAYSRKTPVDVWSVKGGSFGMGKAIAHYAGRSKNPRASASRIPSKWTPAVVTRLKTGQLQLRIGRQ